MSKGPGLFTDIGKKAKDILTANYTTDQKFSVNTCSENGVILTSTALKKGGLSTGDVAAKYKYKNLLVDVNVDTDSKVLTTLTFTEIVPSTKTVASLKFPDFDSGKLEVQYFHHHATFTTAVSLKQAPTVDVSATIGTPSIAFGAEAGYDTTSSTFTKYTAGVSVSKPDSCASIILGDKGDSIRASYLHYLDELKKSAAVGEITRKFSMNENTITVGGSYVVNPLTTVKAKLNNNGKLGALLQHELIPKSLLTISGEVDTKALDRTPKLGVSIALVP
ncbi:mitochondrial outer membrane protein porin 2-like [Punica granatum]|uniref:Uncharacterized protein n=2 Tax=Punica granatum TaxID=22663 RepID=A0A2I0KS46_PUNGR|nr:mitochondrial outer membrane protein porin 2-like [Punica granatum]PKI71308.1 hypothetical protein CRG98_008308 [Punica granatum]